MEYMVTWTEGEEVCYRFVTESEIDKLVEEDKDYIITSLSQMAMDAAPPKS
ncbi:MAG: hypothetical protein K6U74_08070 [Firmicutes bacterium]|nr:hypothetical protein [Bacillota bacterium]